MMRLAVLLPAEILLDEEVGKVSAWSPDGSFTILPRHIDFVSPVSAGLLSFTGKGGGEEYIAVDEGLLVKRGSDVTVAVRNALRGADLGGLRSAVEERFEELGEREKAARSSVVRLETDFMRRIYELEEG